MHCFNELIAFTSSLLRNLDELRTLQTFRSSCDGDVAKGGHAVPNVLGNLVHALILVRETQDLFFKTVDSVLVNARKVTRLTRRLRIRKRRSAGKLSETFKVKRRSEKSRRDDDDIRFHHVTCGQSIDIRHSLENDRIQRASRREFLNLARPLAEQLRRGDHERRLGRNGFDWGINLGLLGSGELELIRQDNTDRDSGLPVANLISHDTTADHFRYLRHTVHSKTESGQNLF